MEEKKLLPVLSTSLMGIHVLPFMSPNDILYLANSYSEINATVRQEPKARTSDFGRYALQEVDLFYGEMSLGTAQTVTIVSCLNFMKHLKFHIPENFTEEKLSRFSIPMYSFFVK